MQSASKQCLLEKCPTEFVARRIRGNHAIKERVEGRVQGDLRLNILIVTAAAKVVFRRPCIQVDK